MIPGSSGHYLDGPSKTSHYRPEIDGLRAFAVIAVIVNHFNEDLLLGRLSWSDIFCNLWLRHHVFVLARCKCFKDFISGFYARRVKRLVQPSQSLF